MTNMKLLAAAAALTLAAGSAFAASPSNTVGAQPVAPQTSTGLSQSDQSLAIDPSQPNVAAEMAPFAHVIGGQTYYYRGNSMDFPGDGAAND